MKTLLDQWRFVLTLAHDKRLSRGDLSVAIYIVDHVNKEKGVAWPSHERLAKCASIARSSAFESVKKLIALGYFKQVTGGGRSRSNRYTPNMGITPSTSRLSAIDAAYEGSGPPDCIVPVDRTKRVRPTGMEPTYPCEVTNVAGVVVSPPAGASAGAPAPRGGAPEGFEDFWHAYPKKEGRKPAIKAYQDSISAGVSPDTLAAKAAQYAVAKANIDPQYLKMPANWLKDRCWLEDPQPPKAKTPNSVEGERTTKPTKKWKRRKAGSADSGQERLRHVRSKTAPPPVRECLFKPGDRVKHPQHGPGRVTSTEGHIVTVVLADGRRKKIRDIALTR